MEILLYTILNLKKIDTMMNILYGMIEIILNTYLVSTKTFLVKLLY